MCFHFPTERLNFEIPLVCGFIANWPLLFRDKKTQFSMPLITLKAFLATVVQSKQNIFSPASSRFKFATVTASYVYHFRSWETQFSMPLVKLNVVACK